MNSLSCVWLFVIPWTVAYQDPQSMGFSGQEYWSGLPLGFPKFYSEFAAGKDPSLMAQMIMNLPAMQETWVWFLSQENPLGKEMATHSSMLTWRILWTKEPGGLQSLETQRVGHDWVTNTFTFHFCCWGRFLKIFEVIYGWEQLF